MSRPLSLVALALTLACPLADASARDGFFADVALGAGEGNFNIDGSDGDEGDTGVLFEAQLGYAFENGFGIGGGLSGSTFAYRVSVLGSEVADLTFTFAAVDLTASYFIELNRDWELTLRGGVSSTTATAALEDGNTRIESDDSSAGVHAAFGAAWFVGEDFALRADLFYRTYGVAFQYGDREEVTIAGLMLGVRWR